MSANRPVLIAGGGLASLLLAQSLRLSGIPFKIFERDASFVFRAQGYRLRLSTEGLDAIESVLDPPAYQRFWDKCGKTGGSVFSVLDAVTGEPGPQPEMGASAQQLASRDGRVIGIARGDMRALFADRCTEHIEWSRQVVGYELSVDGVRATFADGSSSVEGCLLVGGDGLSSRIARQLSGGRIQVYDTGARGIHGQASSTAFQGLGEGVFLLADNSRRGQRVFTITNVRSGDRDDPSVQLGWTLGAQPGVIAAPNDDDSIVGKPAADIAHALTRDWHPRFRPLFAQMNEADAAFWKITCSPPTGVPHWANEPRVTVIGDAAHSMTPAGGNGANTAVRDSALLGRLLREAGGYQPGLTAAYEKEMRVYAGEAVRASYAMAVSQFGVNIDVDTCPTVA
ncbi:2-polyprenyl-6-methoxyphenol hydroxylase-like oxidoreductase [Grosmannia clavigera kw1407]|uniref:2-polyprenyl-6-methoxyphenol hydroxylase-like oxidoreductase n=1 Tax=Grosmannia clavigera (strain kw1407 / UAMH 11150) TaxID=655863 RepID=F0XGN0_GROCL|nr:2-polyprenyl-6-methoxyphenol hydroxylase-like oxidoreductase [Grosmannia clavigera kw1407]EFX02930.1 2-polyprenyl-6-methoxyphenol hydroxylase-like oxidoreductase [Grosmannia clavigera kw1407]